MSKYAKVEVYDSQGHQTYKGYVPVVTVSSVRDDTLITQFPEVKIINMPLIKIEHHAGPMSKDHEE